MKERTARNWVKQFDGWVKQEKEVHNLNFLASKKFGREATNTWFSKEVEDVMRAVNKETKRKLERPTPQTARAKLPRLRQPHQRHDKLLDYATP